MAEAVIEVVLGNLNSLVQKELGLFLGFDQDLERLASVFTTIKATLADAEEQQFSNRSIKDWLQKLKEAAYILDDILDECAYEALRLEYQGVKLRPSNKVKCSGLSTFHPKRTVFRYKIAKKMKRICERLEEIADERTKFHLTEMVPERRSGVIEWRQTSSFISEPHVYGRVSYLNLPIHLKQCFAYCAIFPKDERIEKRYLVELWMTNGFISSDGKLDAEDVGDGIWNELYWRSFFQDIEKDEFGEVESFKMHDLVYDLAQFVADEVCCITNDDDIHALFERKRIHHFSDYGWELHPAQLHQVKSLRTYLGKNVQLSPDVVKCYSLRLLQFKPPKELLSAIGDLKHLRYLNLSHGNFQTLPESLCKLLNLQILKLDYCYTFKKLPDSLLRLKALQQLSLKDCKLLSRLAPHIGKLTSLRNLSMYLVGEGRGFLLAELGPLKLKGCIDIKHLERVKSINDAKESNMSSKQLNKLTLRWKGLREGELARNDEKVLEALQPCTQTLQSLGLEGYQGLNFPQWMSSPCFKSLTYLKLWFCRNCIKLPVLRKLPSLKRLLIGGAEYVKYVQEESNDDDDDHVPFMALEYLSLESLPSLIRLSSEDGENQFPCLSTLKVNDSPNFSLHGLHSLKTLEIMKLPKLKVWAGLQCLNSLEVLGITGCDEVEGLQYMTALKKLSLRNLPNIEFLPDCFGELPLLRELSIVGCYKLMRLPTSLSLSSVEVLSILDCNLELSKRCEKENGEDWHIIAHIPHLYV